MNVSNWQEFPLQRFQFCFDFLSLRRALEVNGETVGRTICSSQDQDARSSRRLPINLVTLSRASGRGNDRGRRSTDSDN